MRIYLGGLNPDCGTVYRETLRLSGCQFVLMSYDRTNPGTQNQLNQFLHLLGAVQATPTPTTGEPENEQP